MHSFSIFHLSFWDSIPPVCADSLHNWHLLSRNCDALEEEIAVVGRLSHTEPVAHYRKKPATTYRTHLQITQNMHDKLSWFSATASPAMSCVAAAELRPQNMSVCKVLCAEGKESTCKQALSSLHAFQGKGSSGGTAKHLLTRCDKGRKTEIGSSCVNGK